jgi:hypothetical protein
LRTVIKTLCLRWLGNVCRERDPKTALKGKLGGKKEEREATYKMD